MKTAKDYIRDYVNNKDNRTPIVLLYDKTPKKDKWDFGISFFQDKKKEEKKPMWDFKF